MIGSSLSISIVLACLLALIALAWRFSSRRRSRPCPVWLRWLVELDNPFTRTNRAAVIIEHLDLQPGMAVLDAGCGPGRLAIPLAQRVGTAGEVVALDIQPGMLKRAREKARQANITNIRFLEAGLGKGRLEQGRFDRAIMVTVLGEIPDQQAAFKELYDALKPGGILSVTEVVFDPHFQSRSVVTRIAEAAGFKEHAFFGNRFAFTQHFEKVKLD